jgi:aminoglycoside phosphotransferase
MFMNNDDQQIIKEVLKKNKISASNTARITSGQINRAYDIDKKYVLKIEGDFDFAKNIFKHQPIIIERLLIGGAKVPEIIDYGNINGKNYLLMNKIKGEGLSGLWHKLDLKQKENFMFQIAEQLEIFHSIKFEEYTISGQVDKTYKKWINAVRDVSDFSRIDKSTLEYPTVNDVEYIEAFFNEKINILENVKESVLVHQDMHFENIFYESNAITGIIDFDWSCQAPREYDLWIIADYFHAPRYFVEKELEKYYKDQMVAEIKILRKYYPELFNIDKLLDKIRLYYITSLIDWVEDYQNGRWSKNVLDKVHIKINDFYRTDWLEKFLLS